MIIIELIEINKKAMKNKMMFIIVLLFSLSCKENNLIRVENYFKTGELSEIYYKDVNNRKQGKYYDFNKNGLISSIFNLKNNRINGWIYLFFNDGKLDQKIKMYNDLAVDTLYRFSSTNGKLEYKVIYGSNEDTIKTVEYYPNGKLMNENIYTPGYTTDHILGYINYNKNGKIDIKHSCFTYIQYLNKFGTKLKFTAHSYGSNHPNQLFTKDSLNIYVITKFKKHLNWTNDYIRMVRFSNWNDVVFDVKESDYVDGKLNLIISPVLKHKILKNYRSRDALYVQLIKGDLSRWHNVHGITK
jgi:antitoxin component YwqK of YwqJK toxin-antitoxin module